MLLQLYYGEAGTAKMQQRSAVDKCTSSYYHTNSGEEYAAEFMGFLYKAEDMALRKTLERYSDGFKYFGENLKDTFEEVIGEEAGGNGIA